MSRIANRVTKLTRPKPSERANSTSNAAYNIACPIPVTASSPSRAECAVPAASTASSPAGTNTANPRYRSGNTGQSNGPAQTACTAAKANAHPVPPPDRSAA